MAPHAEGSAPPTVITGNAIHIRTNAYTHFGGWRFEGPLAGSIS